MKNACGPHIPVLKDFHHDFSLITYDVDRQGLMMSFVDEKIKTLKGDVTCPKLQARK